MKKRKMPSRKSQFARKRAPIPWKYYILTAFCGLLLVGGFFSAACLHFSSIDYGIRNAKLRREIESLNAGNRRLIIEREVAISTIDKTAQRFGFRKDLGVAIHQASILEEEIVQTDSADPGILLSKNDESPVDKKLDVALPAKISNPKPTRKADEGSEKRKDLSQKNDKMNEARKKRKSNKPVKKGAQKPEKATQKDAMVRQRKAKITAKKE